MTLVVNHKGDIMFTPRNNTKQEKQYSIRLTSNTGNTVGFINLSSQFVKAVLQKDDLNVTVEDVQSINYNDFQTYIQNLNVSVEPRHPDEPTAVEDY